MPHVHRAAALPRGRFDATMVLVAARVLDYLGSHQHLAVDLDLAVDERGGLVLRPRTRSASTRDRVSFRFPMLFSGRAELHEWWSDDDESFHVDLEVRNRLLRVPLRLPRHVHLRVGRRLRTRPTRLKPRRTEART